MCSESVAPSRCEMIAPNSSPMPVANHVNQMMSQNFTELGERENRTEVDALREGGTARSGGLHLPLHVRGSRDGVVRRGSLPACAVDDHGGVSEVARADDDADDQVRGASDGGSPQGG